MKNHLKIIILIHIFTLVNCKNSEIIEVETKNIINYDKVIKDKIHLEDLVQKAINLNDTIAFKKALKIFETTGRDKEFIYYSITMAEKNNYSDAYFETYFLLNANDDMGGFNKNKTNYLALFYLFKAYEKGSFRAKDEVNVLYKNSKSIPKSNSFLTKMANW